MPGHFELRQREDDLGTRPQLAEPLLRAGSRQRLLQRGQAAGIVGQEDDHGQIAALVGNLQRLKRSAVEVVEAALQVHQGRLDGLRRGEMEILIPGLRLVELRLPVAFEIDGIGEHQARGGGEHTGLEQVLDFARGLLLDPLVDGQAHRFGRGLEVHRTEARAVIGAGQLEEIIEKRIVLFRPESVGHTKLVAVMRGVKIGEQRAHRRMQPIRRQREMQGFRHL